MKGRFFLAFVLAALAGSALHFGYDLCPSPLVGLICPVSESVWEHLKLLYWPFLASGFLLNRKAQDAQAAWSGTLAALLVMPAFLLGICVHGGLAQYCALRALACVGVLAHGEAYENGRAFVALRGAGDCRRALRGGANSLYDGTPGASDFSGLSEKSLHFPQIYVDIRLLCQYNSWRKQRRSGKHRNSPPALRRG